MDRASRLDRRVDRRAATHGLCGAQRAAKQHAKPGAINSRAVALREWQCQVPPRSAMAWDAASMPCLVAPAARVQAESDAPDALREEAPCLET